jgi:hypothetical protein
MASGKMIKDQTKASRHGLMVESMKVTGVENKDTVGARKHGLMVESTSVNGQTIRCTAMVYSAILMVQFIRATS